MGALNFLRWLRKPSNVDYLDSRRDRAFKAPAKPQAEDKLGAGEIFWIVAALILVLSLGVMW